MAPLNLQFESDPAKAKSNLRKHRVSFEEAATVFFDPAAYTDVDADHSDDDQRFFTIGVSNRDRLLFVSHNEDGKKIRLIGARLAEPHERSLYEDS